ncbi:MAG TPA: DUF6703 family protein [Actinomycetes bacterium]
MPGKDGPPTPNRRSGNPAARAQANNAPRHPSPGRRTLEQRSRPWLVRLNAVPRPLLMLVVTAVMALGLFVHGPVGGILLLLLGLFLGWLLALSWPAIQPVQRGVRMFVTALVLVWGVGKMFGRF